MAQAVGQQHAVTERLEAGEAAEHNPKQTVSRWLGRWETARLLSRMRDAGATVIGSPSGSNGHMAGLYPPPCGSQLWSSGHWGGNDPRLPVTHLLGQKELRVSVPVASVSLLDFSRRPHQWRFQFQP